jgi:hypothetical protein|tara:strand:+ start:2459 stop:2785 length:327 start_codon:yes stop_codon:yes gene_type:complete
MLIINRIIKKGPLDRFRKILNKKNSRLSLNITMPDLIAVYPPADVTPLEIDNVIDIVDNIDKVGNIKNFNLSLKAFECLSFYMIVISFIIASAINKILLTIDRNKRIK